MERPRLAIIIPAFNEEKTINKVINEVVNYGIPIVVDDGSSDDTARIASESGAIVVSHSKNRGYDQALNSGFAKALSLDIGVIMTFDADGQHSASLIHDFLAAINAGADVVIGVRNRQARCSETIFAWVASMLWDIKDPLCGMKAYRSEVYRKLGHFDSYNSIGTELCIFAKRSDLNIVEVTFDVQERIDNPRFGSVWRANLKIIRAMFLGIVK
jgi:glycosyltransferase involved in cell wall biosynthesis